MVANGKEPVGRLDVSHHRARPESPGQLSRRQAVTQYSEEFKASIIAKMLPPNDVPIPQLVRETGIPKDTLYT